MKYRIEVQQIYGHEIADRANAEWLEIDRFKPRGLKAAMSAFDAFVAGSGCRPPIRLVALHANYRGVTVVAIANEWKAPAPLAQQSFFELHDMHFRAVDECINEGRAFSFAEGIDATGAPSARSTHRYNGESYIHVPVAEDIEAARTERAERLATLPTPVDYAFITSADELPGDHNARISLALRMRSLLEMRADFRARGKLVLLDQTNTLIDSLCAQESDQ